jgi:hypothetical protein
VTGDRDRLLESLIAQSIWPVTLEFVTLSIEKPIPAPVSPPKTSPPKRLDRLSGSEYAS